MSGLKKVLGFFPLTFYGVGMILGAGVYSVIGAAAGVAGDGLWLSFLVSAVLAVFTALSYAELVSLHPDSGGEYAYARKAFPAKKWIAGTLGILISAVNAATAATVALAFGGYLQKFVDIPPLTAALGLLALACVVNVIGIQFSSWVNIIFTVLEVSGLILVIYWGSRQEAFGADLWHAPDLAVLSGAALIFFSFLGFENIVNLAEEAKKPEKHLPWAIFVSLGVTAVLYVLVGLSATALVNPGELAASSSPLATALGAHPKSANALSAIALFSTANTALIALLSGSRILYSMSRRRDLPPAFGKVMRKKGSPWVSTLVVLAAAIILAFGGDIKTVASVASFCSLLGFIAVHAAVIMLRRTQRRPAASFRIPWQVAGVPVMPVIGILTTLAVFTQFNLTVIGRGCLIVALGAVIYFARSFFEGGRRLAR